MSDEQVTVVTQNPVNYDVEVPKLTPQQAAREKDYLYEKSSPYWHREHPDHGRAKERVQQLIEREYPTTDEEKNLPEGDRQLLGVLRQAGRGDETSDDELRQMIEEAPTVEEMNEDTAINRGVRDLNRQFGKQTPAVIESAQSLLKEMKISDKDMSFLNESGLGDDPDFISLLGIVHAKIMEARSKHGQTKEPNKPKTKQEILALARKLLKEGE